MSVSTSTSTSTSPSLSIFILIFPSSSPSSKDSLPPPGPLTQVGIPSNHIRSPVQNSIPSHAPRKPKKKTPRGKKGQKHIKSSQQASKRVKSGRQSDASKRKKGAQEGSPNPSPIRHVPASYAIHTYIPQGGVYARCSFGRRLSAASTSLWSTTTPLSEQRALARSSEQRLSMSMVPSLKSAREESLSLCVRVSR